MRLDVQLSSIGLRAHLAAFALAALFPAILSAATLRTVALTGQAAIGMPDGVVYSGLNQPSLNNSGRVAFGGSVTGPGVDSTNENAAWSEGQGSLALIARGGEHAPGTPPGVMFRFVGSSILNDAGQTVSGSNLAGPGIVDSINDNGYWLHGSGGLELIARRGDQAAGLPSGINYNALDLTALNNSGRVVLRGTLNGPGVDGTNYGALWTGATGSVDLLARIGDQAPDVPSGVVFTHFDQPDRQVLNDAGQTAFYGGLGGPGVTSANNLGIWSGVAGSLSLVAREGSQIGGMPAGVNFGTLGAPTINSAGDLAFVAGFSGPGDNGSGIFSGAPGSLALVARTGDQAPGAPAGVNYNGFWTPVLNDQGKVAFHGFLTGTGVNSSNNQAIFSERSGNIEMVARHGDPAPDTPPGVIFHSLGAPAINGRGQIAFNADLTGPATTLFDREGLWATDTSGELHLILRTNDQLEVAPGDFRTVSNFNFAENYGNADGRRGAFNDQGQIAFTAFFTDGSSGVFVSNLVAVPEPAALLLSLAALALAFAARRRR